MCEARFLFVVLCAIVASAAAQENTTIIPDRSSSTSQTPVISSTTTTLPTTSPSSPESTTNVPPSPSTPPPPQVPTWSVKSTNSSCILLRGNFSFAVTYTTAEGNSASARVDIPETAKVSGSCGPFVNSMALTWDMGNLSFMFIKKPIYDAGVDTGNGTYSLTTIFGSITLMNSNDPNGANNGMNGGNSPPGSASSGQTFYIRVLHPDLSASLHNSYSCVAYRTVPADKAGMVYLEMHDVQIEAFHDGPEGAFSPSQPCLKDTMSSVLTILGYAALGGLAAGALGYLAYKKISRSGYTQV